MKALITGVTGQDGPYLAGHLLSGGHEVWGMTPGQTSPKWAWLNETLPDLRLIRGDLLDLASLLSVMEEAQPDVVYNLGALSFVGTSWKEPEVTAQVTGLGCLRMLDAIRFANPHCRFVQASSSEMFGAASVTRQNEDTPFKPRSPYAFSKVFAHQATVNYRESYGMHASTAIMFNHESPRRGEEFVTRKVSKGVAAIVAGKQGELRLGRLDPMRDWGWAPEYMEALPLIAGCDSPGDYVLATGESHSVEELCSVAFAVAGLDYREHVVSDERLFRPAEVGYLRGDPAKAKRELGWEARVPFPDIIRVMVESDMSGGNW
jgi:GDPmannose 4,6-dehydratase